MDPYPPKNNTVLAIIVGFLTAALVVAGMAVFARTLLKPRAPTDEIASIRAAVLTADDAESRAMHARSAAGLDRYYTGDALIAEQDRVRNLIRDGARVESELARIRFDSILHTPGSDTATVFVTEVWKQRTVDAATGVPRTDGLTHDVPQRQVLVRRNGVWLVAAVLHFTSSSPTLRLHVPMAISERVISRKKSD